MQEVAAAFARQPLFLNQLLILTKILWQIQKILKELKAEKTM